MRGLASEESPANVLEHGTGGITVDGCRIDREKGDGVWGSSNKHRGPNEALKVNASPKSWWMSACSVGPNGRKRSLGLSASQSPLTSSVRGDFLPPGLVEIVCLAPGPLCEQVEVDRRQFVSAGEQGRFELLVGPVAELVHVVTNTSRPEVRNIGQTSEDDRDEVVQAQLPVAAAEVRKAAAMAVASKDRFPQLGRERLTFGGAQEQQLFDHQPEPRGRLCRETRRPLPRNLP